jgi:hypothetical protein
MKKLILILIVIAAITEGCKKYEDGPWISFRSPIKRLYGVYTLTKYTVNGEDSLSLFNDSLSLTFDFYYNDIDYINSCLIGSFRNDGKFTVIYMHWKLINDDKILNVYETLGSTVGTGPFGDNKIADWKILKLRNKEIWMKTTYNNKEYYIELGPLKID